MPTFVRSPAELRAIAALEPFDCALVERSTGKLQVVFLGSQPSVAARKKALARASDDDLLAMGARELLWLPSGGLADSALDIAALEGALGPTTIRTMGTVEGWSRSSRATAGRLARVLHDRFVEAIHGRDGDAVRAALAPEVRFFSPVVFKAYEGRDVVGTILVEGAMKVFEDFAYVHRLEDPDERVATLIFQASVGGRALDGLDLLRFDGDGLIEEMRVMVRPLSGTNALAEAMGRRFDELGLTPPR